MRSTPKFNKTKCLKCKYHGGGSSLNLGYPVHTENGDIKYIYCDYMCVTGRSPIEPTPKRGIYDIRGNDYDNCRLYERGSNEE